MRIPNVALVGEAGRLALELVDEESDITPEAADRLTALHQELGPSLSNARFWFYGLKRHKPAERCVVMGDGIEVVRGLVVE